MVSSASEKTKNPPRVFISYSHDSPKHKKRVEDLADALRLRWIDAEFDQYDTQPRARWPEWCEKLISSSDFVLCICTAEYKRRVDREGPREQETGTGAYYEFTLIRQEICDHPENTRFIAVVFDNEPKESVPKPLNTCLFFRVRNFKDDPDYERMLRVLTDQPRIEKTPGGPRVDLPPENVGKAGQEDSPSISSMRDSPKIGPMLLRHGADPLVGREQDLVKLDAAWDDNNTRIAAIWAWGGVGKTSLVVEWMARMAKDNWRGARRVFDWTFYSQGTREEGLVSDDIFLVKALEFFGDTATAQSAASPRDKGTRLAELIVQERTLLVLDGLEPLQYPPGQTGGALRDEGIKALLECLARQNSGLCIVTTRVAVADLASFRYTSAQWELKHLSEEAGAQLLFQAGVKRAGRKKITADDKELMEAVRAVCGHALTLQLLGQYLAKCHNGDIRKRSLVGFEMADAKVEGGHTFRVIATYEKWLAQGGEDGKRQLAVLYLLGLFDRPASLDCLEALRKRPPIPRLTEPLIGLDDDTWNCILSDLGECRLVTRQSEQPVIDCHPLIREYFARQLRDKNPDGWREGHRRLYEHLKKSARKWPEDLTALQPLYQAVAHGCQAGECQRALDEVYFARIRRGKRGYSLSTLSAFEPDLTALGSFFKDRWKEVKEGLKPNSRALVLNDAAYILWVLGRPEEALGPCTEALRIRKEIERWKDAALSAGNLCRLQLTLGNIQGAVKSGKDAVDLADKGKEPGERRTQRATRADALHQAGQRKKAMKWFREAEELQRKKDKRHPWLYAWWAGFPYCNCLLATVERVAWQLTLDARLAVMSLQPGEVCHRIYARAQATLCYGASIDDTHVHTALDHLTLGRIALYRSILTNFGFRTPGSDEVPADKRLDEAIGGLYSTGRQDFIPCALLTRAWLWFLSGNADRAKADLDEAWEIASRGSMRLYMTDIHLYRARLLHGVKPYPWDQDEQGRPRGPKDDLAAAKELIARCGYHRRDKELADAEEAAKNW